MKLFSKTANCSILILVTSLAAGVSHGAVQNYSFNAGGGLYSTNQEALEALTGKFAQPLAGGWFVNGAGAFGQVSFENFNAPSSTAPTGGTLYEATQFLEATMYINGVNANADHVGTVSASNGRVFVKDDNAHDVLSIGVGNGDDNWLGFSQNRFDVVTGSLVWVGGDFLGDESLSNAPPVAGFDQALFSFGVLDRHVPGELFNVVALNMQLAPVPLPASAWLLGPALAFIARRRQSRQ